MYGNKCNVIFVTVSPTSLEQTVFIDLLLRLKTYKFKVLDSNLSFIICVIIILSEKLGLISLSPKQDFFHTI